MLPTDAQRLALADRPTADALRWHPFYRGKVEITPKCPVRNLSDLSVWYTPGVAAVCKAIQAEPASSYENTNRGNLIAIVSDGTRVLGLGDIGPEAGMPVMEGKALLFKFLGGVDAMPLCLRTKTADELVQAVKWLEPSFGGINLEDIAQPKCFRVLDRLRQELQIPVWHDDQQGTATVVLAALWNALKIVGKSLADARIALIGVGAANVAVLRMLQVSGASPGAIVACDRKGTLHAGREDLLARQADFPDKWRICLETNSDAVRGGVAEALRESDVCIAFSTSGPGIIRPEWVQTMARDAIVFACANPVPEIWPWEAQQAGARIVATGRSDFPNQVNNSLGFPGIFRGVLDVRATKITDAMALAAAQALAQAGERRGLHEDAIVTPMDDLDVAIDVAEATGLKAQEQGVARLARSAQELRHSAKQAIRRARLALSTLVEHGVIAEPPDA